jgi:cell wall-associated NlpC family hydrolase
VPTSFIPRGREGDRADRSVLEGGLALARLVGIVTGTVLIGLVALGGCIQLVLGGIVPSASMGTGSAAVVSAAEQLSDQAAVAARCPGLPWPVLAAVAFIAGAPGSTSLLGPGATGPMALTPRDRSEEANDVARRAPGDEDDLDVAVDVLCNFGAGSTATLPAALDAYEGMAPFSAAVLVLGAALALDQGIDATRAQAIVFAAGALGTPYRWGGTGPGGFDCSGLVQAAFASAGLNLPRVAQDQFNLGPIVPEQEAAPGDLVFFGSSAASVTHVGLVIGGGLMIDAPHDGAVVRIESYEWRDLLGATAPG